MDLGAAESRDRELGGALRRDIDKSVAQPFSSRRIAGDRGAQHNSERVEGLGQFIVRELRGQVRNKNIAPGMICSHQPRSLTLSRSASIVIGRTCPATCPMGNGQFCIAALQHGSIAPCRRYEAARNWDSGLRIQTLCTKKSFSQGKSEGW